jgi:hypothetical protein
MTVGLPLTDRWVLLSAGDASRRARKLRKLRNYNFEVLCAAIVRRRQLAACAALIMMQIRNNGNAARSGRRSGRRCVRDSQRHLTMVCTLRLSS